MGARDPFTGRMRILQQNMDDSTTVETLEFLLNNTGDLPISHRPCITNSVDLIIEYGDGLQAKRKVEPETHKAPENSGLNKLYELLTNVRYKIRYSKLAEYEAGRCLIAASTMLATVATVAFSIYVVALILGNICGQITNALDTKDPIIPSASF
jgi:hypothetical protein